MQYMFSYMWRIFVHRVTQHSMPYLAVHPSTGHEGHDSTRLRSIVSHDLEEQGGTTDALTVDYLVQCMVVQK